MRLPPKKDPHPKGAAVSIRERQRLSLFAAQNCAAFYPAIPTAPSSAAIASEHRRLAELGLRHAGLLRRVPQRDHAILDQLGQRLSPAALFPLLTALLNALASCDLQRRIEVPFHARHVVHLRLSPSRTSCFYIIVSATKGQGKQKRPRLECSRIRRGLFLSAARRTAGRIYYGE